MKRILWIVTFAVCSSVWANAQTIADIARQERAKRKETPKAAPITNATVAKTKAAEVSSTLPAATEMTAPAGPALAISPIPETAKTALVPGSPKTPEAPAPESPKTPEPKKDVQDQKFWRDKFEQARVELRRAENQAAVAQLELNAANRDYLTRAYDPDGRGPSAIGAATAKLDAATKGVDQARTKLAQLEEELRRSGAPAGWGR